MRVFCGMPWTDTDEAAAVFLQDCKCDLLD